MKTFKLNLQDDNNVIIQIPEELEAKREEVFSLATIELQNQIASGNLKVSKRIWPCVYCGTDYNEQGELLTHLYSHEALEKKLKERLAHLYQRPEAMPSGNTAANPTLTPQPPPLSPQHPTAAATAGEKARRIRTALGESQAQFARRFHVHQTRVSQWERNMATPPTEVLEWKPKNDS